MLRMQVLRFAVEMFFDSSDDEDDAEIITNKIWNYAEEVVPNYLDRQFQQHFRLTPATFENVLTKMYSKMAS